MTSHQATMSQINEAHLLYAATLETWTTLGRIVCLMAPTNYQLNPDSPSMGIYVTPLLT